jgi:hypothetical protein
MPIGVAAGKLRQLAEGDRPQRRLKWGYRQINGGWTMNVDRDRQHANTSQSAHITGGEGFDSLEISPFGTFESYSTASPDLSKEDINLLQAFLQGKRRSLSTENLELELFSEGVRAVDRENGVLGINCTLNEWVQQISIANNNRFVAAIEPLLKKAECCELKNVERIGYREFYRYRYPHDHQFNYTTAFEVWRMWLQHQRTYGNLADLQTDLLVYHRDNWYPVRDTIFQQGHLTIRTQVGDLVLHSEESLAWLGKNAGEDSLSQNNPTKTAMDIDLPQQTLSERVNPSPDLDESVPLDLMDLNVDLAGEDIDDIDFATLSLDDELAELTRIVEVEEVKPRSASDKSATAKPAGNFRLEVSIVPPAKIEPPTIDHRQPAESSIMTERLPSATTSEREKVAAIAPPQREDEIDNTATLSSTLNSDNNVGVDTQSLSTTGRSLLSFHGVPKVASEATTTPGEETIYPEGDGNALSAYRQKYRDRLDRVREMATNRLNEYLENGELIVNTEVLKNAAGQKIGGKSIDIKRGCPRWAIALTQQLKSDS